MFTFGSVVRILTSMVEMLIPIAMAQEPVDLTPPPSCGSFFTTGMGAPGQGFICAADYVANLTFIVIGFAASISLVMLMVNGFRYMIGPATPGGSSDAAKKGMTSALVGLALSLLTYVILDTLIFAVTQ